MPHDTDESASDAGSETRRDVVVPLEVYKVVTVFSTLLAVGAVVVGFVLLDWGTNRAQADPSEVNVALVVVGLLAIALGAVTYAFSTRFRAEGMAGNDASAEAGAETGKGNSKDEADRGSDNG